MLFFIFSRAVFYTAPWLTERLEEARFTKYFENSFELYPQRPWERGWYLLAPYTPTYYFCSTSELSQESSIVQAMEMEVSNWFLAAKNISAECTPGKARDSCGPHKMCVQKSSTKQYHCVCESGHKLIGNSCEGINTAVSTKVVPHRRKSERDNADWYFG